MKNEQIKHIPVLLEETLIYLSPKKGESYLDLTAGYGGHAGAVLKRTLSPEKAVLVDRDQTAVEYLKQIFKPSSVQIIHSDFLTISKELHSSGEKFDMVLADLGVSSLHLDSPERGFSFRVDGPLDMRMDQQQQLTADIIVNSFSETTLAKIIADYGEEPKAYKIARNIVRNRPIHTTQHLATIVAKVFTGRQKIHPATQTFQALRIAVNQELDQIKDSLPLWIDLLAPGGRIVIISFHSLEDRLVKQVFQERSGQKYDAELELLTKHPITCDKNSLVINPRARSAKLRAAVKIKNRKGSYRAYTGKKQLPNL
ncbi:MAG: 16S rRNA (cytosine(1402)-N(4))-methyltransferase RsmH [Candidatus Saccharimonadales bacterium]